MEEDCRRKGKDAPGTPAAGWESIYCSLILILVAFFAMLVSYATVEGEKSGTKTNYMRGFGVEALFEGKGNITQGEATSMVASSGLEAIALTVRALKKYIGVTGLAQSVCIEKTSDGLKIVFNNHILFPPGKAELNKNTYVHLDQIIAALAPYPFDIRVEGHTDDLPIHTVEFPSNWELSATRAVRVVRYFLEKGTIQASRMEAVGCGSYHPVASNASVDGRKKNRRVEFHVKLKKDRRFVWKLIKNSFKSEGL